jgi:hypothetical protein
MVRRHLFALASTDNHSENGGWAGLPDDDRKNRKTVDKGRR